MNKIDELKDAQGCFGEAAIKQVIPYQHPFLMIDKITSLESNKIVAWKTAKASEEYFKGHFVGFPIMPGALIVEGMGQAGTFLVRYNIENHETKDVLAYKIKEAKFSAPAFPGSTLKYEITLLGMDERGAMLQAKATSDDTTIAECMFVVAVVDRDQFRQKHHK